MSKGNEKQISLTRQEVRDFDKLAIEQWGVPSVVLMENAGRGVADAVEKFLQGDLAGKKIAIVAGVGNNGGDGFVAARHLHIRAATVKVFVVGNVDKMTADASINFDILKNIGIDVHLCSSNEISHLSSWLEQFDLIIDALGGTGITGALRGDLSIAVEQINSINKPVVAVDIPTGLDCDTGQVQGPAVRADLTVTFVARKVGFDTPESADYTGEVIVADIGVPLVK
ncbi:MAG: NAD(P)H-hydrate epimerase [Planctomycetes bacterium]|nr:NAD(P)H-hydrate epimerase [Planctomycetota bacterium]